MSKIYWVGTKESELRSCKHLFDGSITFIGSGRNENISFSSSNDFIINYNEDSRELDQFMENTMLNIIAKYPDVSFFCYTTSYIFSFENPEINKHIICGNNRNTLQMLRNKMDTRLWLGRYVPVLPTTIFSGAECTFRNLCNLFSNIDTFTIQGCTGAGGVDTYIMDYENNREIYQELFCNRLYLVSPFMKESYSTNVHVLFDEQQFVIFPGSLQIVEHSNHKMIYRGADFIAYQQLPSNIQNQIQEYAETISSKIQFTEYRGILGIDFLVSGEQVFFLEINPRFQSSTSILNLALTDCQYPTIQEMILDIFAGKKIWNPEKLKLLKVPYSNYIVDYEPELFDYAFYTKALTYSDEVIEILWDGYTIQSKCQQGASIFCFTLRKNISSISTNGTLLISDNIRPPKVLSFFQKSFNYAQWLKIALMNQGIHFSEQFSSNVNTFQQGVYSSLDVYLTDEFIVNCPTSVPFHTMSPFVIDSKGNSLQLYYGNTYITEIKIAEKERYCDMITKNGIPYTAISFLATDRVRIHHSPKCIFQQNNEGCKFCDVPGNSVDFTMEDIKEVIDWQLQNSKFRHFLIGGASGKYPHEQEEILEITKYIRSKSDKPIYVMSLPPKNLSVLDKYFAAGVNEVAFNIEIYDRNYAKQIMHGKGDISLDIYKAALLHSVQLWGMNGNVKSILVYGLEPDTSFLEAVNWLASHGIQPVISPFRPLSGTPLENRIPPTTEQLMDIYFKAENICRQYQLSLGPSCIYCQNNTLSFNDQTLLSFDN